MALLKTMSTRAAASELGYNLAYLYQLIWAGKVKAALVNGRWVVDADSVELRKRMREASSTEGKRNAG